MKKILQFPIVRITTAIVCVGIGLLVGQVLLNLLRAIFSISNAGLANILAFLLITPLTYFGYRVYVYYVEKRSMIELDAQGAVREFGSGSLLGLGLFSVVVAILWLLGFYRVGGVSLLLLSLLGALLGALVSGFVQELIFRAV